MHQVLPPEKLTQASYKFVMPEAVCCCLQTYNVHQSHSQNDSVDLRGVAGGDGELGVCVVRQAPVICVMAPPIHLGAWSMAMAAF